MKDALAENERSDAKMVVKLKLQVIITRSSDIAERVCDVVYSLNHLLRGSGSTVLTATGSVYENPDFRPPQNRPRPLNRSSRNLAQVIMSAAAIPILQIWCKSAYRGLLGKCVKYNQFVFLFIYKLTLFLGTYLQVKPVGGFSRLMAQTTQTHERVCFWGFVDIPPHLGGQIISKPMGA